MPIPTIFISFLAAVLALRPTAASAFSLRLGFYTGEQCTGQEVWGFTVSDTDTSIFHDMSFAPSMGSFVAIRPWNDEIDGNECFLFYGGKDFSGRLIGRGQKGCAQYGDAQSLQRVSVASGFSNGKGKSFNA